MIKGPLGSLDNFVSLDEKTHTYTDRNGKVYESVSKFRDRFKKKFDPNIAYQVAGKGDYVNMSPEQVLLQWDTHRDNRASIGTNLHLALERFERSGILLPEEEPLRPAILSILSEYKGYHRIYQEQILYDTENMIAGTADKLLVTSKHADAPIDISDYKSNAKGIKIIDTDKKGKPQYKYFLHCLSHLIESKFSDYAIQLSTYCYFLEKKTGRRIGTLRIHYIDTSSPLNHYFIPIPYMKFEVMAMLKYRREHPHAEIIQPIQNSILNNFGPITSF